MQKKKAISLIVLVITVIVMIVLAGAIILSLNNSGIIGKANQAVKVTDEATVKEIAQMAWGEAYAEGIRHVKSKKDENGDEIKGLEARVKEALKDNGVYNGDEIDYFISVTDKGVSVKHKSKGWIQTGTTVKKGNDILNVGEKVNYIATGKEYSGEWKVLGADENGDLLIMSASNVEKSYRLGVDMPESETIDIDILKKVQEEWKSGAINKLDELCESYGEGEGAIGARSIRVEDIDRVTEYDKTTYQNTVIEKYGNIVTYKYDTTLYPVYVAKNVSKSKLTTEHKNGFYWYDGNEFKSVTAGDLTNSDKNGEEIATITSTYYGYAGTKTNKLTPESEAYKLIFGTSEIYAYYWIASNYILAHEKFVQFGLNDIRDGGVYNCALWESSGTSYDHSRGVRAVVTLSSDVSYENLVK